MGILIQVINMRNLPLYLVAIYSVNVLVLKFRFIDVARHVSFTSRGQKLLKKIQLLTSLPPRNFGLHSCFTWPHVCVYECVLSFPVMVMHSRNITSIHFRVQNDFLSLSYGLQSEPDVKFKFVCMCAFLSSHGHVLENMTPHFQVPKWLSFAQLWTSKWTIF